MLTSRRAFHAAFAGVLCGLALTLPTHGPRRHSSLAITPTCGWHDARGLPAYDGELWGCSA